MTKSDDVERLITPIEASGIAETWGHERTIADAASDDEAIEQGTLLRIAIAVERIADLLDPEVAKKAKNVEDSNRRWDAYQAIIGNKSDEIVRTAKKKFWSQFPELGYGMRRRVERKIGHPKLEGDPGAWAYAFERVGELPESVDWESYEGKVDEFYGMQTPPTSIAKPGTKMEAAYQEWRRRAQLSVETTT